MGKGIETASVIFVVGPSTAGKSTICKAIKARAGSAFEIFGHDQLAEVLCAKRDEKLLGELKENPRFQEIQKLNPKFNEVKPRKPFEDFAAAKIYQAISEGKLEYQGQTLDLLDAEKFNQQLKEFLEKTDREFFNEEILRNLQTLTQEKHKPIKAIIESVFANFENDLFDHTIASSKAGKPIVLDVIPDTVDGKSLVQRFEEYCAKQNHHCPTFTALVHLPVRELTARMKHRNAEAIARDEPSDQRLYAFPFRQLTQLVEPAKQLPGERIVSSLTSADLDYALSEFSELKRSDLTKERREFFEQRNLEMREKFGFGKTIQLGDESKIVELVAIPPFDQVYDLTSKESTELVAQKICALATHNSKTPTEIHPIATTFREKFGDNILQDSEESFVSRLGLKATVTKEKTFNHVDYLKEREEEKAAKDKNGRQ